MKAISAFIILFTLPQLLISQLACEGFFSDKPGTITELTHYDKNNAKTGSTVFEVMFQDEHEDGGVTLELLSKSFNKKGEPMLENKIESNCKNGVYYTSVSGMVNDMYPKDSEMEVTISGNMLQYPNQLTAGQKLPDADIKVKTGVEDGLTLMTVTATFTNRQVEGFEKITTPAGEFDCVKISYDYQVNMIFTRTLKGVEYVAKGVGVVKCETFDKKGKLIASTLLTALQK
jgi:hypothetical protein